MGEERVGSQNDEKEMVRIKNAVLKTEILLAKRRFVQYICL